MLQLVRRLAKAETRNRSSLLSQGRRASINSLSCESGNGCGSTPVSFALCWLQLVRRLTSRETRNVRRELPAGPTASINPWIYIHGNANVLRQDATGLYAL